MQSIALSRTSHGDRMPVEFPDTFHIDVLRDEYIAEVISLVESGLVSADDAREMLEHMRISEELN